MSNVNSCKKVVSEYLGRCKAVYNIGLYGALMRDKEDLFQGSKDFFKKEYNLGEILTILGVCEEYLFRYFERRAKNRADMWFWLLPKEEQELRAEIDTKLVLLFNNLENF